MLGAVQLLGNTTARGFSVSLPVLASPRGAFPIDGASGPPGNLGWRSKLPAAQEGGHSPSPCCGLTSSPRIVYQPREDRRLVWGARCLEGWLVQRRSPRSLGGRASGGHLFLFLVCRQL